MLLLLLSRRLVRAVSLGVVVWGVVLAATSAHSDVILYQTSFDTDTTDVPGTYAPFGFDPIGSHPASGSCTPAISTGSTQGGLLHIHRGSDGCFASPELTLSSQELLGMASYPSVFSVSFEMGGESGNVSWWGTSFNFNSAGDTTPIHIGMVPGCCAGSNFHLGVDPNHSNTAATGAFIPQVDTLYPFDMTVIDLEDGSYQFDFSVTNSATSVVYTDSKVVTYPYPIAVLAFQRSGLGGGGDGIFDNLTISTPVPEPNTALLLGIGMAGLAMKRRRTRKGCCI